MELDYLSHYLRPFTRCIILKYIFPAKLFIHRIYSFKVKPTQKIIHLKFWAAPKTKKRGVVSREIQTSRFVVVMYIHKPGKLWAMLKMQQRSKCTDEESSHSAAAPLLLSPELDCRDVLLVSRVGSVCI